MLVNKILLHVLHTFGHVYMLAMLKHSHITYRCTLAEFILGLSNDAQKKAVSTSLVPVYAVLLDTLFHRAEVNSSPFFSKLYYVHIIDCSVPKMFEIMLIKKSINIFE